MKTVVNEVEAGKNVPEKFCVVPVSYQDSGAKKENIPKPMNARPSLVIPDLLDKGLDNPTYYDPKDGTFGLTEKKPKFAAEGLETDANCAKLTKIPGLNIWRLDFKKSPSREKSAKRCCRLASTLAIVAILAILLAGIAILTHAVRGGLIFGMHWLQFEDEGVGSVQAHFRIMNRDFHPDLSNASTSAHRKLVGELRHSLDVIFMDSSLVNHYNASDDFVFSNGSVVVSCLVLLQRPLAEGAQRVGYAFVKALEEGKGILPPGLFYIDVHTVRFAAVKKEHLETRSLRSALLTSGSEEEWSDWSSCLGGGGSCDASRVRVRRRRCLMTEASICLAAPGAETVETRPCLCPPPADPLPHVTSVTTGDWSSWGEWSQCVDRTGRCDAGRLQRRTRTCTRTGRTEPMAGIFCSRTPADSSTQLRHCRCDMPPQGHRILDVSSSVARNLQHNDEHSFLHWLLPIG